MSILQVGNTKPKSQSGFTLIEVMVVLLIVGLMAGITVMNMPAKQPELYSQGRALASRLEQAAQLSLVEQTPMGIKFTEDGYALWAYQDGEWASRAQYTYDLSPAPKLRLSLNGAAIKSEAAYTSKLPALHYGTTGLASPFEIILETNSNSVSLQGNTNGNVKLTLGEAPHE